jgi:formylglycine-generating enzyme required for sulfatase activity
MNVFCRRSLIIWWMVAGAVLASPVAILGETLQDMLPGVVRIIAKPQGKSERYGSGFIIQRTTEQLVILTAAHVVEGDQFPMVEFFTARGQRVKTEVQDGSELDDRVRGLALLIVWEMKHVPKDVKVLRLTSEDVQVSTGEPVVVLGHPRGAGDWVVIHGHMVSRRGRDLKFDARIDEGASGGPIIQEGQVVGLVQTVETYAQGNPADSIWGFLQGFGIRKGSRGVARGGIISSMGDGSTSSGPLTSPIAPSLESTKTGKDGAPMVLVSAGTFTMGSPDGEGDKNEHPQHDVYLKDFYIDQYEVTVERYQRFMKETNRAAPADWEQVELKRDAQKPVVGINWQDAKDYCEWAGKRLPTEAEWEKAARGTDKRIYPWGNDAPDPTKANFGNDWSNNFYTDRLKNVGSYERGKSPYGAYQMAGNVWEWVQDWYAEEYYQKSPRENPLGPSSGERKVLRGGSWAFSPGNLRSAARYENFPTLGIPFFGVRCAQDAR